MQATIRTTVTARSLNSMIQAHIESRSLGEYVWHSGVYGHPAEATGCNWNIAIHCKEDFSACGAVVSSYLEELRHRFVVGEDDIDALPRYESDRVRELEGRRTGARLARQQAFWAQLKTARMIARRTNLGTVEQP
jgi:hypothetical protein